MPEQEPDSPESADPVEHREVWDKMPAESQKAFSAFCMYRDAEKRSFKLVADQLNCSPQNVFQWSSKFNWRLRCDAYDVEQDRLQRQDLARGRVRMRERHLKLAIAMQGLAAHALREWQARIASGQVLNLAPEQIALLTKCAVELERSTIGVDGEHRSPVINILFGTHKYSDEKAGNSGEVEGEVEWKPQEAVEREQYDRLNDEERRSWCTWKNPPPKRTN
jgi:hypothetical protein